MNISKNAFLGFFLFSPNIVGIISNVCGKYKVGMRITLAGAERQS
jgi:hypothetical protein